MKEAFTNAYDDHSDALFRFCYFRVHNKELAKDILQETFTRAWAFAASGKDIDNMRALLYRIMRNLIIDSYRKHTTDSLDALTDGGFDPANDGGKDIIKEAEFSEVVAVFEKLDPKYREVLELRYLSDLGPNDIAEVLGESANTISVRLNRAIKQVREILEIS